MSEQQESDSIEQEEGNDIADSAEMSNGSKQTETEAESEDQSDHQVKTDDEDGLLQAVSAVSVSKESNGSEVFSSSSVGAETSGYLGGSGSTSMDEITDVPEVKRRSAHATGWLPGKRHADEDDTCESWRNHKKHFFVLSNAGKPVFSRYGNEHKLAGFTAALQAFMSFVENSGDRLHLMRAGNHQFVFLVEGPLYLVSITATDEPYQAVKRQLRLLHGQIFLILTKSVEKCFAKNATFDMKPLLGGTDVVFSSLIHSFNWNPTVFLHAYACLPLPYAARQTAGAALQDAAESGVLFALLMSGHKVINMVGPRKASLHPDDLFLLSNFITSSDSFRTTESFSPVCLPHYNPNAFVYAYVQYLNENVYIILISTNPDSFYHLKDCRTRIELILRKSRVLHEANRSVASGGLLVKDIPSDTQNGDATNKSDEKGVRFPFSDAVQEKALLGGPAGLWHFIYKSTYLEQYVASEFTSPLHDFAAQKRLFRAYQRVHYIMHDENGGYHKMQYRRDENYVLMYWRTSDFELYAAFDPLAEKSSAIRVSNLVCQWLRNLESEVFLLGAAPFNW